ncbi:MAG: hypothetical protein N2645_20325 [Clostridia bacterium]|nr:hypothetical protein [Clostridia bacterium]
MLLYVYIGFFTFGLIYSAVSMVLGGHDFHGGDFSGHGHDGNGEGAPSPLSPLVIASAVTAFGAVGLIGKLGFKFTDALSIPFATICSVIVGAVVFFGVVRLLYRSQSNSSFSLEDLTGVVAEVITPIPQNGLGEIAYVVNGVRYNNSAKSLYGEEIKRGHDVIIMEFKENVAMVVRKISIDSRELFETNDERVVRESQKINEGG